MDKSSLFSKRKKVLKPYNPISKSIAIVFGLIVLLMQKLRWGGGGGCLLVFLWGVFSCCCLGFFSSFLVAVVSSGQKSLGETLLNT